MITFWNQQGARRWIGDIFKRVDENFPTNSLRVAGVARGHYELGVQQEGCGECVVTFENDQNKVRISGKASPSGISAFKAWQKLNGHLILFDNDDDKKFTVRECDEEDSKAVEEHLFQLFKHHLCLSREKALANPRPV